MPRPLQASANVWYQCIKKSLPLFILIFTVQSSFPKDSDVFPSRLTKRQRVEDSPICTSHDLLRLKVTAIVVSIFKPRVNSETATAQSTLIPSADVNQASTSNPFLAKRILTKTHSDQISPVRANYSNIYGNHTEARVFDQFFFRLLHLSRKALFKRAGRRYCIVFKFSRQYIIIHKNIT